MSSASNRKQLQAFTNVGHQVVIALIFISVVASIFWSLNRYWQYSLQPRLYLAAKTQATVLAQSQATTLIATLENNGAETLTAAFRSNLQQMLIVEDPAIGGRYIRNVSLDLDYDTLPAPPGSLDFQQDKSGCSECFDIAIPLIGHLGDLYGVAHFKISDAYFQNLSSEMRSKLYAETSLAVSLLLLVWLTLAIMFHRLHRAKQKIEASDQAKTRFMANVTHELRTPLNAILGFTQLYKKDPQLMQKHGHGIDTIDRSAAHLLLMINDILEFSRSNADRITLNPVPVGFAGFLQSLVEMIRVSSQAKALQFVYMPPDFLPEKVVFDEKRLRQVLLNLLNNAVKFTAEGQITFRVDWVKMQRESGHGRLRFSVLDTGIGIAKHQLQSIFIPFQQLDNAITRAEGTGLGLTISQHIVHLMAGQLQVKSMPGLGSEFWFELDLPFVSTAELASSALESASTIQTATCSAPGQNPIMLPDLAWPSAEIVQQLQTQARQHNILALRQSLTQLETDHPAFVQALQPFVRQYQFKALVLWLEQQRPDPSQPG